MKAFRLNGDDGAPDLIKVYATREEWSEVAADLYSTGSADRLLTLLLNLGVDVD